MLNHQARDRHALVAVVQQAGMVPRRFWEPYHEARKVQKMTENARMDQAQLRKAFWVADDAAAKVIEIWIGFPVVS